MRLRRVFDNCKSLLIEIRFGEGGDDAKHFVKELSDVYRVYAAKKGFTVETLDEKFGSTSLEITGNGVWQAFQSEIGKHVVQRCPPNERGNRKHTSVIAVGVMKLFDYKEESLNMSEVEITAQKGKVRAGGQNANKVSSAIRAVHLPTKLQVFISGRDQKQNKKKALQVLAARVNEYKLNKASEAYSNNRKAQIGDAGRSGKARTYNFFDGYIQDHNTNKKTHDIKNFMKGNLNLVL